VKPKIDRRQFIKYGAALAGLGLLPVVRWAPGPGKLRFLRPPGSLEEEQFVRKCMRCGLCGDVCPNQCLNFFDIGSGPKSGTPFIVAREQGCTLCMKCTQVCPSGAIQPIPDDLETIGRTVSMGKAVIDKDLCYSYNDRICGICYRACPLQNKAITIGAWERPEVVAENCVGCGLCERICYHYPQAIRVIPTADGRE